MANELSVILKAIDQMSPVVQQAADQSEKAMGQLKKQLMAAGAAFTAVGVAGLKLSSDARKMNADLAQTGITIGQSTKTMRDMALATTDVSFPLESVTATFELLARAGVKNTDVMKAAATAFDTLGDATKSNAETVAGILIPAFKNLGVAIPTTAAELDKFTWLVHNTTVDLADFGSAMDYVAAYGSKLNITVDQMVAIMAALEAKGISGSATTKLFRTAVTEAATGTVSLNQALGLTEQEIGKYLVKLDGATGSTQGYGDAANTQFGIMQKISHEFSKLALQVGTLMTPLEPLLAAMTAMGPVMIFLSSSIGINTAQWMLNRTAMVAARAAALAQSAVTKGLTAVQWLWNAALTANPIGIVIVAIGALIAAGIALWRNWDQVTAFFSRSFAGMARDGSAWARDIARSADQMISDVRRTSEEFIAGLETQTSELKRNLDQQVSDQRRATDDKIAELQRETQARLKSVDEATTATIDGFRTQRDAIDAEIAANREARTAEGEDLRVFELQTRIDAEKSATSRADLQAQLVDLLDDINNRRWERDKRLEQDRIDAEIANATTMAIAQKTAIEEEAKAREATYEAELADYAAHMGDIEFLAEVHLKNMREKLAEELEAFKGSNADKLTDARTFVEEYNRLMAQTGGAQIPIPSPAARYNFGGLGSWAAGGTITEPTLLYGLHSQRPYAIAGEAGPERVVPGGQRDGTSITNHFAIAQLVVREEADIDRIAEKLYRMQSLRARYA